MRSCKGVRQALKEIHQAGVPGVVVITNQSIIGRGMVTEAGLSAKLCDGTNDED